MDQKEKYPEGHFVGMWIGICMAIFSGVAISLTIITKSSVFIGMGPAIGVAIGVAIGKSIEEKYKRLGKIRPPTKQEKKNKKILVIVGIIIFLLGFATLLGLFLLR